MNAGIQTLDWQTLSLAAPDRALIEASAGTGKTWTIAALYLRLLLEGEKPPVVENILVATFSEAAARELRERLRERLADAERVLQRLRDDGAPPATDDGVERDAAMAWLVGRFAEGGDVERALRRIRLARMDFDRAPIGTIHSLCQRFLRDFPLDSGMAATSARLDEDALLRECVEDFWRRRYLGDGEFDAGEVVLFDGGPEKLLRDVRGMLAHDARVLAADGVDTLTAMIERFSKADYIKQLRELANNRAMFASRKTAVSKRILEVADLLESGSSPESALAGKKGDVFDKEFIDVQQAPGVKLIQHALILDLRRLRDLLDLRKTCTRGRVLAAACEFCRAEIPRRAVQRQGMTYSLLIANVHERARDAHGGFAQSLFTAFPCALVDEFQDTDARQFEIFDRIYRDAGGAPRGWLAMIGDPKQAIYGFRGGDIAAYLTAREGAATRRAMDTNYRATQALVDALNALYGGGDGGFGDAGIAYQTMRCGGHAEKIALCRNGTAAPPLHIHRFRRDGETSQTALESIALDDCAQRIVELLNDPAATLGDQSVAPGDIAVLVPNNTQIAALRKRLVERGVPCVGSGRESVFEGETAEELELFLAAVMHPDDDGAVCGALATTLLGFDLRGIVALQADAAAFERELERFARWQGLAQTCGVFGAVAGLIAQRAGDLLRLSDGERILADLRHLGELIAAHEAEEPGIEGVIAWFGKMRRESALRDERGYRLRSASDAGAVQIMTLHAAKGLEFPVVFLPLAWRTAKRDGQFAPKVLRFHDGGTACIDVGSSAFTRNRDTHFAEDLGERQRLLYVAMTRAKSALHVYWADLGVVTDKRVWKIPAIDIVLRQAFEKFGLAFGEADLPALASGLAGVAIVDAAVLNNVRYAVSIAVRSDCTPCSPLPAPRRFEWLHSFSGILRGRTAVEADAAAADEHDAEILDRDATAAEVEDRELKALESWRGKRFGDAVHKTLEAADMRPVGRSMLLGNLTAQGRKIADDEAEAALLRMLERVRTSDLGAGLRLADLSAHERVAEFGFRFPISSPVRELRAVCASHGFADVWPAHLRAHEFNGMLNGYADLIFHHGGRYHVLDYKTNRLGTRLSDYAAVALEAAMTADFYPLQALLYTVALHRYLQGRLDGYTPERHLGDSVYLFLRGVGLAPGAGVWRRRWPAAFIRELDDVFAGVRAAA